MQLNHPLITSSKIALCVAIPSTAIFFYLLWKQAKESTEYETITTRQTVIDIKIPADLVGLIIGPEGSTIKEIQKQTGARIHFKKNFDEVKGSNEDRVLLIRGNNVNAQQAELEIRRILAEKPVNMSDQMMVPKECCGRIIGREGSTIKAIAQMSGCKVNIPKHQIYESGMAKVLLTGSIEQIMHAKSLIHEKVKDEEEFQQRKKKQNEKKMVHSSSLQNFSNNQKFKTSDSFETNNKESIDLNDSRNDQQSTGELDSGATETNYEILSKKPVNSTMTLEVGKYQVFMSAVVSPHRFWIQIHDENGFKLDRLIDEMREFYDNKSYITALYLNMNELKVGDVIAASHKNNGWYRCEVLDIRKLDIDSSSYDSNNNNNNNNNNNDTYEIKVFYIDFGDTVYIRKNQGRKLVKQFNELPGYAIECSLNAVEPEDGDYWSDESVELFERITHLCDWKALNATLSGFKDKGGEKRIPLIDLEDPAEGINIAAKMIENGHAIESTTMSHAF